MAITWRNVNGPSNDGILRALVQQPQVIGDSLNQLGGQLNNISAEQDTARVNNLLAKLDSFKTIDEVNAFEQSEEGQMLRNSIVRNENQAAVRNAPDARIKGIQDGIIANNTFTTNQQAFEQEQLLAPGKRTIAQKTQENDLALLPKTLKVKELKTATDLSNAEFDAETLPTTQNVKKLENAAKKYQAEDTIKAAEYKRENEPYINSVDEFVIADNFEGAKKVAANLVGPDKTVKLAQIKAAEIAYITNKKAIDQIDQNDLSTISNQKIAIYDELTKANNSIISSDVGRTKLLNFLDTTSIYGDENPEENKAAWLKVLNKTDADGNYLYADLPIDAVLSVAAQYSDISPNDITLSEERYIKTIEAGLKRALNSTKTERGARIGKLKELEKEGTRLNEWEIKTRVRQNPVKAKEFIEGVSGNNTENAPIKANILAPNSRINDGNILNRENSLLPKPQSKLEEGALNTPDLRELLFKKLGG
jgi:hypothetical protein